jgi:hypothetical protein
MSTQVKRTRWLPALATVTVAVGTLAGTSAIGAVSASATPTCGNCLYVANAYAYPGVLDAFHTTAATGNKIVLWKKSGSDPGQDFVAIPNGTVGRRSPLYTQFGGDPIVENQYTPYGSTASGNGLCVGTTPNPGIGPVNGTKVVLEPCGSLRTDWVLDTHYGHSGHGHMFAVEVSAASQNGVLAQVLDDPAFGWYNTGRQLDTYTLNQNNGHAANNQLWTIDWKH